MDINKIAELAKVRLRFDSIEAAMAQLRHVDGVGYTCYNPDLRGIGYVFGEDGGMLSFGGMMSPEDAIKAYTEGKRSE